MEKIYWSALSADDLNDLRLSYEDFFKILDCYYGNIFVTDGNGIVLYFNEGGWANWGLDRSKHIGKHVSYLRKQGIFKRSATEAVLETKKEVTIEIANDEENPLFVYAVPIFDDNDNIIFTVHYSQYQKEIHRFQTEIERNRRLIDQMSGVLAYYSLGKGMELIYHSEKMAQLMRLAKRVAQTEGAVLIRGESGTGKELLARYIFHESTRSKGVFLPINCAAIPSELIESELFGYEAGSFTGANKNGKAGVFELADKGTLFLDEIGELPLYMQSKLLRALESGEITRVGAAATRQVDVRIVAATNRDLQAMVKEKTFREDLFYRLNVIPLELPPLRERTEDILPLAEYYLKEYNARYHQSKCFSENCQSMFLRYKWPGNIRELKNMIHRMVIATENAVIESMDLGVGCPVLSAPVPRAQNREIKTGETLKAAVQRFELEYIQYMLKENGGNVTKAAAQLGVHRSYIYRKLKTETDIEIGDPADKSSHK